MDLMANIKTKVILVGVGGATCSGKTTLAKHMKDILPNSVIVHQDDFFLPEDMLSTHQGLNTKNWDAPSAIDWPRIRKFLRDVKCIGGIPLDHISCDTSDDGRDVPIDENRADAWKTRFQDLGQRCLVAANTKVIWVLVDGFMLYWDQDVIRQLDVCIFLRVQEHILKERRETRFRVGPQPGVPWIDPEGYWDIICYPEYIVTHKDLFKDGKVETGEPNEGQVKQLLVIEPEAKEKMDMIDIVEACLEKLTCAVSDLMGH
ncbi:P-loop containing nucleoside triphosphate hydrolase protein [Suillus placidus]|uniref:P-loop containing nucleoside triphosphate hydrolase protein n=1 Tax=Suillus placidus TaxID=48579 RepID=A0A9P6ZNN4_9AGAM|nr:P-loop containing nucleoside triphosphate hydrolase protein [Suillus placidus]